MFLNPRMIDGQGQWRQKLAPRTRQKLGEVVEPATQRVEGAAKRP